MECLKGRGTLEECRIKTGAAALTAGLKRSAYASDENRDGTAGAAADAAFAKGLPEYLREVFPALPSEEECAGRVTW